MSSVAKHFRKFPKEFSPVPIWWWSGEKLERERLRWQLERFAEGGVYNLIVLNLAPTGPMYGKDPDDPPFFSDEWWEIFKGVCQDAKELGVYLWFYDQIGFSGANIQGEIVKEHPEYVGQSIERVVVDAAASTVLECPAGGRPLRAFALKLNVQGEPVGIPQVLPLDGTRVVWPGATETHRIMLVYTVDRGFDYYNPEACAHLIDTIHGAFDRHVGEYLGDVIVGSFQDELPSMPLWGPRFAEEFRTRRGYDILDHLPALWEDYGEVSDRVRFDYHTTRADLCEEAFFQPLYKWHEDRGLLCGFDQQGPVRQGNPQRSVEIYADYMRTHRWFSAPGTDHHGHAKIHSSLAHLYGRPRSWIEAFHSSGWGGTLEETFDWLVPWLRAGANLYDPHAVYYSTRGGWWEWAPPSTCWRQPYWKHYRQFAEAVSRLCAALSEGVHECDVGILFPTSTVQAGSMRSGLTPWAHQAHEAYRSLVGSMIWHSFRLGILDQDRRDYDVLDDASVQRAKVEKGSLCIAGERYRAIILPSCVVLDHRTARVLLEFVESGGRLVAVGDLPRRAAGMAGDPAPVQKLAEAFADGRAILVDSVEAVPGALADMPRPVEAPVPVLRKRVGHSTLVFVPATASQASRVGGGGPGFLRRYDFEPQRYARKMKVTVRGVQGAPLLWEPFSGRCKLLPYEETADGVTVEVSFGDGPAVLLEWGADVEGKCVGQETRNAATLVELDGVWQVDLVPTLDNRWGDFDWPKGKEIPVQTWSAGHFSTPRPGRGVGDEVPAADDPRFSEVRLTFGPRGWHTDVLPAAALPDPLDADQIHEGADLTREADLTWNPVVYSLSRGIFKDRLHRAHLGVSGHVPEEFLDFGDAKPGQGVQMRTWLYIDRTMDAFLAVGAPARKTIWLNGKSVGSDGPGYLEIVPVGLKKGYNLLELRFTAENEGPLRGHFALVQSPERYVRPEWMQPEDRPVRDSVVAFTKKVELPFAPTRATLQLGAEAPCRLLVNGQVAGEQGAFDPYGRTARILPYDITALLRRGENEIRVEVSDLGASTAILVDAVIEGEGKGLELISDGTWAVTRDGKLVALGLRRKQWGDPSWALLRRRPHPLPQANWLEEEDDTTTVIPAIAAATTKARVEWYRIELPPGARAATFTAHGEVNAYVEDRELAVSRGDGGEFRIDLSSAPQDADVMLLRVEGAAGYTGGGVFESPICFDVDTGRMHLGDWTQQGLSAYSGGVRYTRAVQLTREQIGQRVVLDLGRVRGTAEVKVNGHNAGVRVLAPYRFDVQPFLHEGENTLEITVYNTLAPYLDAVSATYFVFSGQKVSGLFGPVRLLSVG